MVKGRPVMGWLILALIVGLELLAVSGWPGRRAGEGAGQTVDARMPALTMPFPLW